MSGLMDRLLGREQPASAGQASAGRATAPPADVAASGMDAATAGQADRRDRLPGSAESQIEERIGQKVLHGWLQNRQQTLMPLSVNFARLSAGDRIAAMRFAAVAALAAPDRPEAGRADAATSFEGWLSSVGAGEDAIAVYRSALAHPPALHEALAAVRRADLAPLAFVTALVAGRDGGAASRAFADYVAASLALPTTAIRSAERRYRI